MYTVWGGYLITIIGLAFMAVGIFAGKAYVKYKNNKDNTENTIDS